MKTYKITRNPKYDFLNESYSTAYPNLHKYPATMLPQIGINLFKELNIKGGRLLDPYCGSGTSFIVGLDRGLKEIYGFDINPLAILIAKGKFTKINIGLLNHYKKKLRNSIFNFVKKEKNLDALELPNFFNIDYWFSQHAVKYLSAIKKFIDLVIEDIDIKKIFLLPFSETVRECSYTKNSEFKLYRIKSDDLLFFNPDILSVYFSKLNKVIDLYQNYYYPKLNDTNIQIKCSEFKQNDLQYDIVLTSPPYGDSKTTVAYGQFSTLSNEWLGVSYARQVDKMLMGGRPVKSIYRKGIIADYICAIEKQAFKRALEVSSFYEDLENSIKQVSQSINKGGKVIYIVGNRRAKNIQLPTNQFIAEKFEENGLQHLFTYERLLGNKVMPSQNSPTNRKNARASTMTQEFIVVCEK